MGDCKESETYKEAINEILLHVKSTAYSVSREEKKRKKPGVATVAKGKCRY